MRKVFIFCLLSAVALSIGAQQVKKTAKKALPEAVKAQAESVVDKKSNGQESDESGVMIDDRPDYGAPAAGEDLRSDNDDFSAPGGIPASYGKVKGTLTEGGRNILVFESDNGTIYFVQVTLTGKNQGWKLVFTIPRSAE